VAAWKTNWYILNIEKMFLKFKTIIMKKLGKLQINAEKVMKHDELITFRGGGYWKK
jgi:hypothetical protein